MAPPAEAAASGALPEAAVVEPGPALGGSAAVLPQQGFGQSSLFDFEVEEATSLPFELPSAHYLNEALLGMHGAPAAGGASSPGKELCSPGAATGGGAGRGEVPANWRRLRRAVSTPQAAQVCSCLAWLAIGALFGTLSEGAAEELRKQLSTQWFSLTTELGSKGREWLFEALPVMLSQAIYRLLVDTFPPEHQQLVLHAEAMLEKLTIVVHVEVIGLPPNPQTVRQLRHRFLQRHVLEHPHVDQRESRRHELRQKQLEGARVQHQPLNFGRLKFAQPLEKTQLEHVMELRARERERPGGGPGATGIEDPRGRPHAVLPPLCPPELSVDRYANTSCVGEEMFVRHLSELQAPSEDDVPPETEPAAASPPEEEPEPAMAPSRGSPALRGGQSSLDGRGRRERSTARLGPTRRPDLTDVVERRRRDEMLAGKLAAPLPHVFGRRSLATGAVSPVLDRVAPGVQQPTTYHRVRMSAPNVKFLPQLASSAGEPSRELGRGVATGAGGAGAGAVGAAANAGQKSLPKIGVGGPAPASGNNGDVILEHPPLRTKHQVVLQRLENQFEAFKAHSFDQYKRDYDITTGAKKSRLDGERLAREEKWFVQRLEALVGSRSTPALQLLGGEFHGGRTRGPGGGRRAGGAVKVGGSPKGVATTMSPTHGRKQPWDALTSLEGWRPQ